MNLETNKLVEKIDWAFHLLDLTNLIMNEQVNSHSKRALARMSFIQVDNILKIAGRLKNSLHTEGAINLNEKMSIERDIEILRASYESNYNVIRHKLSAHGQPLPFSDLCLLWNEIDHTLISVFYSDARSIQTGFDQVDQITFRNVPDFVPCLPEVSDEDSPFIVSTDRLSATKPNTVSLMPCHPAEKKGQLVASIIDLIKIDLGISLAADAPDSIYKRGVSSIGWMLFILDICSLIDNLFESNDHDQSLLEYWKDDFLGYEFLLEKSRIRDHSLEDEIRNVRNRFVAHLDSAEDLGTLRNEFESLDLAEIHEYACNLIKIFHEACRMDIRTKRFLIQDFEIKNVERLALNAKPF